MEILMISLAGICLLGLIAASLFAVCAGGMLVEQDRAKQESARIAEEPKLCFDGFSRIDTELCTARLLREDKRRRKRL